MGKASVNLVKLYSSRFSGIGEEIETHHIVPKTRLGVANEFNLFPYDKKAHAAYHVIFLNLKVDEIWEMLNLVYHDIFESNNEYITQRWFGFCQLDIGTENKKKRFETAKIERLSRPMNIEYLQKKWEVAFGDKNIETARKFLKLMMLFMIFGVKLLDKSFIFNNECLGEFFKNNPIENYRLWAFEICFGPNLYLSLDGDRQAIKLEIASIINSNILYSKALL